MDSEGIDQAWGEARGFRLGQWRRGCWMVCAGLASGVAGAYWARAWRWYVAGSAVMLRWPQQQQSLCCMLSPAGAGCAMVRLSRGECCAVELLPEQKLPQSSRCISGLSSARLHGAASMFSNTAKQAIQTLMGCNAGINGPVPRGVAI